MTDKPYEEKTGKLIASREEGGPTPRALSDKDRLKQKSAFCEAQISSLLVLFRRRAVSIIVSTSRAKFAVRNGEDSIINFFKIVCCLHTDRFGFYTILCSNTCEKNTVM